MRRLAPGLGLALLAAALLLAACQRNAPPRPSLVITNQPISQAGTVTNSLTPTIAGTPTPVPTGTATPTPSVTPTPTQAPTPTPTPIPSARLAAAQQAFDWGDYRRARDEFAALLADPGADEAEIQLAAYWVGRSALEAGDYEAALEALQGFLRNYPDDPQAALVHLLMARAYEGLEDWRAAIVAYQAYLRTSDDTVAIYAYQDMGDAAMLALEYDQAAKAYAEGLRIAPDNGWVVAMREGIARSELARSRPNAAVEQYDAILSVARIPAYRARILYLAGQALALAGDTEAAHQRYLEAVSRYPEAYDTYLALVELVRAAVTVDDYQRGLIDYYAQAYQPAIEAFNRYIQAHPKADTGDAVWYLALALKANGNLLQAIQQFEALIDRYPKHEHAAEAWLKIAESYAWRGDTDQAIATYRKFAEIEPQSPLAVTALRRAAELERSAGDLEKAAASFRDLAKRYPAAAESPPALFQAGLLDYRRAEFTLARDTWQKLVQDYPDDQAALGARYWLGKAWLALKAPDQARVAFEAAKKWAPTSYYGLRAAEMLGETSAPDPAEDPPSPTEPTTEQAIAERWLAGWLPITNTLVIGTLDASIAQSPAFRRGDALLAVGRRADALDEFKTVQDAAWDDPQDLYQLALAFRDRGLYRLSIICAERLTALSPITSRAEMPVFIQRLSFPFYYRELIVSEAQAGGIDPLLLLALIRQESLFEPSSKSPANARGLTQVIPATGDWIAGRLRWDHWAEDDLWLPYVNIRFGTYYLGVQISTFDGQVIPALAAYNAGPGRIHTWLAEAPDIDLFVETMPFAEPRRYVRNVYENYGHYRRLYQDSSQF